MPTPLWTPSPERIERAALTRFARERGLPEDYRSLHRWSIDHLEDFWAAIWDEFEVVGSYDRVLETSDMPGARWFPGAQVNYAEHLFAGKRDEAVAIHHASESRAPATWTWADLRRETSRIRSALVALGVSEGDRVAALMPNIPETIAAFLATASLGAIWSSAAPEFGAKSVIDRFGQIGPTVLLVVDGYRFAGRDFDCHEKNAGLAAALPQARVVRFSYLGGGGWDPVVGTAAPEPLHFARVAFDHPLWVLYSSGTTGLPKAIVHGQGGVLLEHLKLMHLHVDASPQDRVFWFTTTGWMMWNFLVGVLLTDAAVVLFDGSPVGGTLWELAERTATTTFGTSASFIAAAMKEESGLLDRYDLSSLDAVGSTGSPLTPEGFAWIYEMLGPDLWLYSTSGGSDVVSAFVGGVPTLPVYAGELQGPALGAALEAWSEDGVGLVGRVGELVLTKPMPSMPLYLWNDRDGALLRESYFERFPGVWRHGDWIEITPRGTAIIHGRSDATINRGGVRMGTSEIYRAVSADDDVVDALVVDLPQERGESEIQLFVVLRGELQLDAIAIERIRKRIRTDVSPRHVPDRVEQIEAVPRTLSGKALEVPVKRILMGERPDAVVRRDGVANPEALDWFVDRAR